MTERIRGVVGFAFSEDMSHVLVIRKHRGGSHEGKLNGVGGKLEAGEDHIDAMVREFREETRLDTAPSSWLHFATMTSPKWEVAFFKTVLPMRVLEALADPPFPTDEQLELWELSALPSQNILRNMRWLLPLCLDTSPYVFPITFQEK